MTAAFNPNQRREIRRALARGYDSSFYEMVPATYGGETYEYTCKICRGYGNVMGGKFTHEEGCPVDIEEKKYQARGRIPGVRWYRRLRRFIQFRM